MPWWLSRLPRAWRGGHGRLLQCETCRLRPETPPSLGCKISDLASAIAKYCWSSKTSWASPQQHAGASETVKNCIEPILMGRDRDSSILLSFTCVKWLSDQIYRHFCKFGRSATITLHTRMLSEGCCLSVWRAGHKVCP